MYKNAVYSILQQLFTFLLPLVVIPYISRVLGPTNIGIYSYINSIVSYFMLFSLLGISTYGVRLISKTKFDKKKMSCEFWSLYKLQIIFS
ncbi:TPA: oligosaccharide flippase family protein, partial [Streptococcus suis]